MTYPPPPPGSLRPTRKVTAATLAALVWAAVVAVCARLGVDMGAEVQGAVAALLVAAAGYWTTEGA